MSKTIPSSTVGRGKRIESVATAQVTITHKTATISNRDSCDCYCVWPRPDVIISDGAYGILGFNGDVASHDALISWYENHIRQWSEMAKPNTTLWFWNSEIGWATIHPLLEKHGWEYRGINTWNKGLAHIAGNVNTKSIRRFPPVTEVCAHYVFKTMIEGTPIKDWLYNEWKRTGLPFREANIACGVKDVATRKYFDRGHLFYSPPPEMFERIALYANANGIRDRAPFFVIDGKIGDAQMWRQLRGKFYCPVGVTNVWDRPPLKGKERISVSGLDKRAAHLNQKPLDLFRRIICASSDENDVVWEPFGGLMTAAIACIELNRQCYSAEIDPDYFKIAGERVLQS